MLLRKVPAKSDWLSLSCNEINIASACSFLVAHCLHSSVLACASPPVLAREAMCSAKHFWVFFRYIPQSNNQSLVGIGRDLRKRYLVILYAYIMYGSIFAQRIG